MSELDPAALEAARMAGKVSSPVAEDIITAYLARRSIQDQPEAVAWRYRSRWVELPKTLEAALTSNAFDWSYTSVEPDYAAIDAHQKDYEIEPLFASAPPPIAGAGWKLTPEQPTHEMGLAGFYEAQKPNVKAKPLFDMCVSIFRTMIAASPTIAENATVAPVPDNTDARGTQVKALEWSDCRDDPMIADSILGTYRVQHDGDEPDEWSVSIRWKGLGNFRSDDEAKAAAQAHFDAAIRAAIIPGTDAANRP